MQNKKQIILKKMLAELDIPESAYDKAVKRYEDIGDWFGRKESSLNQYDPHVFSQGSFRLGTVIKPLNHNEEYDLDLSCVLRQGISKKTHTQEYVKNLVGKELEAYRIARGIQEKLELKHRCWRLIYQDELSFHADIVPAIPEDQKRRIELSEAIRKSESDQFSSAAETTIVITDDRNSNYRTISDDWKISNPEGYASWFEDNMLGQTLYNMLEKAQVDKVPTYKKKTPLQQAIQLLKQHRDIMFAKAPDKKPISIIITTLAARAYNGESDLGDSLTNILNKMESLVRTAKPRVPNPVDPNEDFADKWTTDTTLEANFKNWLAQAKADFDFLEKSNDVRLIAGKVKDRFSLVLNESDLAKSLGMSTTTPHASPSRVQVIDESRAAKPWEFNS
ncbi:MAG: nucleotidyltransferase [Oligoflexia bacterium]|nr:nucleotidyltransferase [Oligoflexia bacterium]